MKPHRATLILILGILSIPCCGLFTGIPAWVMATSDLKEMDAGLMDPNGRSNTNAGKICGIIGTCLSVVGVIINLILLAMGAFAGATR